MTTFFNRRILLGITGGIAAYKSVELVRHLKGNGAQVRVIMTAAATEFVTPLTLQAVSQERVYTHLLDVETETTMGHIELARWAEVVLIAPATADFLAKLAHGHANDLLSTVCLATSAPIIVAPAMNQQMWQAKTTQDNCERLRLCGVQFFGPTYGKLACGEVGAGRMLEPMELINCLKSLFEPGPLEGRQVLVTAGPTCEDIDPVRFISNRSSGKMGYAVAQAAQEIGAQVTLISGPVSLPKPPGMNIIFVRSAQDMFEAVFKVIPHTDIFIAVAAVADYRPVQQMNYKLKKDNMHLHLDLERTPDILAEVTRLPHPPFTVGFAAETEQVAEYALDKLRRKKLNMIAANQIGIEGIGFESEDNALRVLWEGGNIELPRSSKQILARELMKIVIERYKMSTAKTT